MKVMSLVVMVQLAAAGGTGVHREEGRQADERNEANPDKDVGKHFSELMKEWKALKEDFEVERQKARQESEKRKREAEVEHEQPRPQ